MKNSDNINFIPKIIYDTLWKESVKSIGRTSPNPPVAAVIAHNNEVIATGATEPPGQRHAEIVAFDHFDSKKIELKNLDLYITLEPCSTYGRTQPCILRIKNYQDRIRKIYVEEWDPSLEKMGIKSLIQMGLDVEKVSIFQKPHFALHPFLQAIQFERPQYLIKIATDRNFFIGGEKPVSITGELGKMITMLFRSKVDAVLVGPGTTAIDQPSLDFRKEVIDPEESEELKETNLSRQTAILYDHKASYDEFLRGLFLFLEEVINEYDRFSYQPIRVFLLGRYFENFFSFYQKQLRISEKSQKDFYFLIPYKYQNQYPLEKMDSHYYRIFPNYGEESFFSELNQFFISLGVYRVLVESGRVLFDFFFPHLNPFDFIYWIQNQQTLAIEDIKEKKYWFFSEYPLLLKDQITLKGISIYSFRKMTNE
ncbi:MAG: hypothetical protein NZ853_09125 [Leptospiraceae bacterium]|nr:hypothetical protein [Leptospiraceae bacterium]MDW7975590.1 hypothetical protein [Leptospiraceae bacterium]